MFLSDLIEEFFARIQGDGSPKRIWTAILAVVIGIIFTGNLVYWISHASEVFTFTFIQNAVELLFPWLIVTGVVAIFSANGYRQIKNKLSGIETDEPEDKKGAKHKARSKSAEDASDILDSSASRSFAPEKIPTLLGADEQAVSFDDELADLE